MANMPGRSLIDMGVGGPVVVIPKAWARRCGLQPRRKVLAVTNVKLAVRPPKGRGGDAQES